MRDVLFILITVGFFAVCAAFVGACARIIGPDELAAASIEEEHADQDGLIEVAGDR